MMSGLWLDYEFGFSENKQKNSAEQQGNKCDNTIDRKRKPSTGQDKKTLVDSNYL